MKNQKKNAYLQNLSSTLNQMREQKILTDLEVICDSESFHVHSAVMSASSTYFRNLLNNPNKPIKISLNGIQPYVFSYLLNFIYTGTVEESLDIEKLGLLIEACTWLNIPDLFQHVGTIAAEIISYANYFTIWNMADQFRIQSLNKEVEDFAASNYMKLTSKDTFLELSAARLKSIFSNRNFREISPENILISLSNWAQHKTERQKQLPQLVQHYQDSLHNRKGVLSKKTIDQTKSLEKDKRNNFFEISDYVVKPISNADSFESNNSFPVGLSVSFEAPEKDTNDTRASKYRLHPATTDENIPSASIRKGHLLQPTDIDKHNSHDSTQTYCICRSNSVNDEQESVFEGTIQSEPVVSQSGTPKKVESVHSCHENYLGSGRYHYDFANHLRRCKGTIKSPNMNIPPPKRPLCLQVGRREKCHLWKCHSRLPAGGFNCYCLKDDPDVSGKKEDEQNNSKKILTGERSCCGHLSLDDELKDAYVKRLVEGNSDSPLVSAEMFLEVINAFQNAWKVNETVMSQLIRELKMQRELILSLIKENKRLFESTAGSFEASSKRSDNCVLNNTLSKEKIKDKNNELIAEKCDGATYASILKDSLAATNNSIIQPLDNYINCKFKKKNDLLWKKSSLTRDKDNQDMNILNYKCELEKITNNLRSISSNENSLNKITTKHSKGKYNIIGCRDGEKDPEKNHLRAAVRNLVELYIGRCESGTTEQDLRNYLVENGLAVLECERLKGENSTTISTSFRVKVQTECFESLFNAQNWPKGIVVHPFYRKNSSNYAYRKNLMLNNDRPLPFEFKVYRKKL